MSSGIHLREVTFEFRAGKRVLNGVTLSLRPGEFIGIVGPNASGKTTLARIVNASLEPTAGTACIDGLISSRSGHVSAIKALVALIGSDSENQLITSSVYEEIASGLQGLGLPADEVEQRCAAALDDFELQPYRDHHPFALSVGEQFRLLLAVSLVRQPRYLVLDEVLVMLDGRVRQRFLEILLKLRQEHALGILVLSHRLEDLMHADRVVVLNGGEVAANDVVATVFAQAMATPSWQIQPPHTYQVYCRLPPEQRGLFSELAPGFPLAPA